MTTSTAWPCRRWQASKVFVGIMKNTLSSKKVPAVQACWLLCTIVRRLRIEVCCNAPRGKAQIAMRHNNHCSVHADKLQKSSLVLDNTSKQHKVQAVQACGLLCIQISWERWLSRTTATKSTKVDAPQQPWLITCWQASKVFVDIRQHQQAI